MTSRSGQKGSFPGALVQSWRKGKERSHLLAIVSPKSNKKLNHGWRAYCELLKKKKKWKVTALRDFLGKRGLTVTGNKELLVNHTVMCITMITAHDIHIAAMFVIVWGFDYALCQQNTFWRQWSGVGPYQTQGPASTNLFTIFQS